MAKLSKKKVILIVVAVVVVVVVGIGFGLSAMANQALQVLSQSLQQTTEIQKSTLISTVSVTGAVQSASVKKVYLEANGAGKVLDVPVKVGDVVTTGDVLCVLDAADLQKEYDKQVLQYEESEKQAKLQLSDARSSYSSTQIKQSQALDNAQDEVDKTLKTLNKAIENHEKAKEQIRRGQYVELMALDMDLQQAWGNVQNAEAAYDKAVNSTGPTAASAMEINRLRTAFDLASDQYGIAIAKYENTDKSPEAMIKTFTDAVSDAQKVYDDAAKRLQEAKATGDQGIKSASNAVEKAKIGTNQTVEEMTLEKAMENIEKCTVTASASGVVTAVYAKQDERATERGLLFVIEDLSVLEIETTVKEYDVGRLAVGMPVTVKTDSTDDVEYEGKVTEIDVTAVKDAQGNTVNSANAEFRIKMEVKPGDGNLRVGMNARAKIIIAQKEDVFALPYSAIDYDGEQPYVMVQRMDEKGVKTFERCDVTLGIENDYDIEIISEQLAVGDQILDDPEGSAMGGMGLPFGMAVS